MSRPFIYTLSFLYLIAFRFDAGLFCFESPVEIIAGGDLYISISEGAKDQRDGEDDAAHDQAMDIVGGAIEELERGEKIGVFSRIENIKEENDREMDHIDRE